MKLAHALVLGALSLTSSLSSAAGPLTAEGHRNFNATMCQGNFSPSPDINRDKVKLSTNSWNLYRLSDGTEIGFVMFTYFADYGFVTNSRIKTALSLSRTINGTKSNLINHPRVLNADVAHGGWDGSSLTIKSEKLGDGTILAVRLQLPNLDVSSGTLQFNKIQVLRIRSNGFFSKPIEEVLATYSVSDIQKREVIPATGGGTVDALTGSMDVNFKNPVMN